MSPDPVTRRLVDLQVLLGVAAICLAERNAALAGVAVALYVALRAVARLGPRSPLPLPTWASNVGALLAVLLMLFETTRPGAELVVAMGHFTVMLQGLLLAGRRSGRDDAMLLVLGLIQALAASVLSSTVLDGALLMAWCLAAAAALLRLSMRGSAERVRARNAAVAGAAGGADGGPAATRPIAQPPIARVFLAGAVVSTLVATAVFVATPRRESDARPEAVAALGALRGTGFAARVELGGTAPQRVLDGPVLHVTVRQGGGNIGRDGRDFLLRGVALDRYEPADRSWMRSPALTREDVLVRVPPESDGRMNFTAGVIPRASTGTRWEVDVLQRGAPVTTLFLPTSRMMAAGTPLTVQIPGLRSLSFNPLDRRLQAVDQSGPASEGYRLEVAPLRDERLAAAYERFRTTTQAEDAAPARPRRWPGWLRPLLGAAAPPEEDAARRGWELDAPLSPVELTRWEVEPERVRELADHVLAAAGLSRDPAAPPEPDDRRRVERLEHFLRTHFDYALDNPEVPAGKDPVISFLFENRRGHCELFAAGLVALCRSVGIPARIATGYRAGEFNALGGYYVVRPEHAHAWVEAALGAPAARRCGRRRGRRSPRRLRPGPAAGPPSTRRPPRRCGPSTSAAGRRGFAGCGTSPSTPSTRGSAASSLSARPRGRGRWRPSRRPR